MGFFDNMSDRPIRERSWKEYQIVGDIHPDAVAVNIGCMLIGSGKAWLDGVSFEILGETAQVQTHAPPKPLDGRALENLVAFTRLLGYVRFFHPSDQAAENDWEAFVIHGVEVVEDASTRGQLAEKLEALFHPIAPTVRVFPTGQSPDAVPPPSPSATRAAPRVIAWRHQGVGLSGPRSIYFSRRVGADLESLPSPEEPWRADLGGGLSALIPLTLYAGSEGTLPRVEEDPPRWLPESHLPSGDDRLTRLADVALAWNVFQHFYPYFDVVETDWDGALREALRSAATDRGAGEFLRTLRRLVARLHDGHGGVYHPTDTDNHAIPLLWDWIENHLVITHVPPTGTGSTELERGDIVLTLDGKPALQALHEEEALISGATDQWKRHMALQKLRFRGAGSASMLEIQRGEDEPRKVVVQGSAENLGLRGPRPAKTVEIQPGIWYVGLDRMTDEEFQAAVPRLAEAEGIIYDLRGYPQLNVRFVIGHSVDSAVTCAQWLVPIVTRPDREGMDFHFSNWSVLPRKPRFTDNVAYLTDRHAISYAETWMGIIEHYDLAEIVGGPTAGTNGNVNPFTLPGGYRVTWTGMKVLKHDGSRHHGIGILPTVPVKRTIRGVREGRDEVLERATQLVQERARAEPSTTEASSPRP
jgi:C-terminal processing protease CtpA/Prc